ncbi:MAG: Large exoprotein involved in heme utilization or adhesion [Verrucomicrobia bacterium]|nr:MAG: Large exoprotein involved in heme utilization or adhesion [Verrucomicrobiota bacterium]
MSVIQGALNANGHVFLLNPNGVLFTQSAQVNVGGIVASTLHMKTEDFMAGRYTFEGAGSGTIVNQGNITAA